jgi:preprotein translocase subunit Sec61beta
MVKFVRNKPTTSGPSSAIGITRFFDAESKSPKMSPYFILGLTVVFIIIVILFQLMN